MINLKNISKSYPVGGRDVLALDRIDLDIVKGEIFGIIGSSGAGKSTLVRLINLLEQPTAGEIRVDGRSTRGVTGAPLRAPRRDIGMVFQHFNLLNAKTVAQNIAFPLQLAGVLSRAEIEARVGELIARVGLGAHAQKYPRQLSGGQKQRVGIARALASKPQILLCDEATSALDPETTQSVLKLLAEINRELGITIVLITHEMDVVREVCDRVAVLDQGRVVEWGKVADVFLHPRHKATLRLVREAEHGEAGENARDLAHAPGPVYRLTFLGEAAHRPILGAAAREFGIDYSILAGRIGHIRLTPFAQLTVSLVGGSVFGAISRLEAAGVVAEKLSDGPVGIAARAANG
ncbi:methionine ABC transporter ATP-binding protein [Taklimakanibacter deserti]|uniref:methionine ABC transporter ATP-binding protein n=1 Tax=Taklimakanibacter deserti TaxID=2267839 RepID=UPI000E6562B9